MITDSSSHALAVPSGVSDFIMHPLRDPQIPEEQEGRAFERWVSGYYARSIPTDAALQSFTLDELKTRLAQQSIDTPPPEHVATIDRLSPEEYPAVVDPLVTARSHLRR